MVYSFKVGDVALFLPSKNSPLGKPWAAFNINAPFHFMNTGPQSASQLANKEYIVARITNITEHTASFGNPDSAQYNLSVGTKYRLLEVEDWRANKLRVSKKRHISKDASDQSTLTESTLSNFSRAYSNEFK